MVVSEVGKVSLDKTLAPLVFHAHPTKTPTRTATQKGAMNITTRLTHQLLRARFWNPDRTVRSDWKNLEPFSFTVYLGWRTVPYKKSRDPHGPRSDRPVLWTVTGFWGSDGFFLFRLFRWICPIHRYKFMIRSRRNERTWREQRSEGDLIISDLEQRDL